MFRGGNRPPRTGGFSRNVDGTGRDGRGKPFYDRHSGSDKSGIKPVEKRDGTGAHNWGNVNDDLAGQEGDTSVNAGETGGAASSGEENNADVANADPNAVTEGGETSTLAPVPEEPKLMTLEEYKKIQKQERAPKPKFDLRKPGDGQDNTQWKKTFRLDPKKNLDDELKVGDDEEYEEIEVVS